MSINLNDFLGQHLVLLWLMVAVMLAAFELIRRDLLMAVLAGASVITGLSALIWPHAWYAQLCIFVVLAVAGEIVLALRRRAASTTSAPDSET